MKYLYTAIFALLIIGSSVVNAQAMHNQIIQVGSRKVTVHFTDYPVRAERSLHITFQPEGGIEGLKATGQFIGSSNAFPLSRFPSNRKVWGFDNIAFNSPGKRVFELNIQGVGKGRIEFIVGERPTGPNSSIIYALGVLPVLAVFLLAIRSWLRVQPAKQRETYHWQ